jgi:hypothetical protein
MNIKSSDTFTVLHKKALKQEYSIYSEYTKTLYNILSAFAFSISANISDKI